MRTISMMLVALFLCVGNTPVDAQFGRLKRKIKDKIERKIERKVDQKIDEEIDEAFEGGEKEDGKKKNKKNRKFDLGNIGMSEMDLQEVYEFDFQIDWKITSSNTKKSTEMSQLMSEKKLYFGMEMTDGKKSNKQATIIFDLSKEYMVMIPGTENQAMVTSFSSEAVADEIEKNDTPDTRFTATGKKKQILNYICEQYTFSTEGVEGEFWVTEELDMPNFDLYTYMKKMSRKKSDYPTSGWANMEKGFVLEMTTTDSDGNTSKMETIRINKNAYVKYDMSKYKAMNISGMEGLIGQ